MNNLLYQIHRPGASAFTHSGKFHADDVFSAALLLYLNPEIMITRGNRVPEDFDGIVFDIGRGQYDHHQKDSRIRENGITLHLVFYGKSLAQTSLGKTLHRDLMKPLCSHLTTMTIQVKRTSLPH